MAAQGERWLSERRLTVEHRRVRAAEGRDSDHTLALNLALTKELHAGAAGGSDAACDGDRVRQDRKPLETQDVQSVESEPCSDESRYMTSAKSAVGWRGWSGGWLRH